MDRRAAHYGLEHAGANPAGTPGSGRLRAGLDQLGRQYELETATAAELAVELDPPAERQRQLLRDRQPEARALAVMRPERPEDALLLLGRDPRPGVLDRNVDEPVVRAQAQVDRAPRRASSETRSQSGSR